MVLQGEQMSKATFPYDTLSTEIICRYKLINEEIPITSHYCRLSPFPNSPGKAVKSK